MDPSQKYDSDHHLDLSKAAHVSDGGGEAPMLSAAVLNAPAGGDGHKTSIEQAGKSADLTDPDVSKDPTKFAAQIQSLLTHIKERLDNGLDEAWESPWGYDGTPDPDEEEQWARIFSEISVFAAYAGVAGAYGTKKSDEGTWDMEYAVRLNSKVNDPCYPPVLACQHLTNYCVITRGYDAKGALGPQGMTAGAGTGSCPAFNAPLGTWTVTSSGPGQEIGDFRNIESLITANGLPPGSVFAFNKDGPDATGQRTAHIGAVLRVCKPNAFQGIDTGPFASGGTDSGTADHGLTKKRLSQPLPNLMVGVGILTYKKPDQSQIDFLKTARPLGFAQLVLADASSTIRYISRLLPMFCKDQSYSVARYIWSLRNLPTKGCRAFWLLTIPRVGDFSRALLAEGARDRSISDLVPATNATDTFVKLIEPVHVMSSNLTDDKVRHDRRKMDGAKNEWSGVPLPAYSKFPAVLRELKFADSPLSLYVKWQQMKPDVGEYTCVDPSDKANGTKPDVGSGLDYWRGQAAPGTASSPAPSAGGTDGSSQIP